MALHSMIARTVTTVPEFVQAVIDIRDDWSPAEKYPELWFRGIGDGDLQLLPGAYWRKDCDEQSLVLSFRNMVPSYIPKEPQDDWEWYYLMQHYGLPTRLLDWTENPLVALFFALEREGEPRPCVWVLDPVSLNQASLGLDSEVIIVPFGTGRPELEYWLPRHCTRGKSVHVFTDNPDFRDNARPLAVFPKRYNPRIVAQRGVFTVHGIEEIAIDALMNSSLAEHARIAQVVVAPSDRERLFDDLWSLGITRAALFPEPQSVAEDLKRSYHVR